MVATIPSVLEAAELKERAMSGDELSIIRVVAVRLLCQPKTDEEKTAFCYILSAFNYLKSL
jgi:hypothetical protein